MLLQERGKTPYRKIYLTLKANPGLKQFEVSAALSQVKPNSVGNQGNNEKRERVGISQKNLLYAYVPQVPIRSSPDLGLHTSSFNEEDYLTDPPNPKAKTIRRKQRNKRVEGDNPDSDAAAIYFEQISKIPLLTAEDEVRLAKLVEEGKKAKDKKRLSISISPEDQTKLRQEINEGEKARRALIEANLRLVISIAKRYQGYGVPLLDLVEEGNLGLIRAVDKFDHTRGHRFSTYATWSIRKSVSNSIPSQGRAVRMPEHWEEDLQKLERNQIRLYAILGHEPSPDELAGHLGWKMEKILDLLVLQSKNFLPLNAKVKDKDGTGVVEWGEILDVKSPDGVSQELYGELDEELANIAFSMPFRYWRVLAYRLGLRDGIKYGFPEIGEKFGLSKQRIEQMAKEALQGLKNPQRSERAKRLLGF